MGVDKSLWPGKLNYSSGGKTEELAKKYFSQMRKEDIEKLYEMYFLDFEMFGYSPEDFIALGKTSTK